jgi:hypothetical protein
MYLFYVVTFYKQSLLSFARLPVLIVVQKIQKRVQLRKLHLSGCNVLPRQQKATALAVDECVYSRDSAPLSAAVREANRRNQVEPRGQARGAPLDTDPVKSICFFIKNQFIMRTEPWLL